MGNDLVERQSAIDALDGNIIVTSRESAQAVMDYIRGCADRIRSLPSAQPELIAQGAYVRGFEQGRTQGMLDAKLEPTCNQLATDTISRQAAIDALTHKWDGMVTSVFDVINSLPSAQTEPISEEYAKAVGCWLMTYQIKCAELRGRYTPYEILGWIISDWRKDNGI